MPLIKVGKIGVGEDSIKPLWTKSTYILSSGVNWYRREINNALGYFKLWYSDDSGGTWEEIMELELGSDSVIIDLAHVYTHSINGTSYEVRTSGGDLIYST